jgi:hypothetical protein
MRTSTNNTHTHLTIHPTHTHTHHHPGLNRSSRMERQKEQADNLANEWYKRAQLALSKVTD